MSCWRVSGQNPAVSHAIQLLPAMRERFCTRPQFRIFSREITCMKSPPGGDRGSGADSARAGLLLRLSGREHQLEDHLSNPQPLRVRGRGSPAVSVAQPLDRNGGSRHMVLLEGREKRKIRNTLSKSRWSARSTRAGAAKAMRWETTDRFRTSSKASLRPTSRAAISFDRRKADSEFD